MHYALAACGYSYEYAACIIGCSKIGEADFACIDVNEVTAVTMVTKINAI